MREECVGRRGLSGLSRTFLRFIETQARGPHEIRIA
jgi:hypothetical protein